MASTILFDLDGTLTDPGLGITNAVMYALRHYNIEPPEREALYPFIGPPLHESFMRYFGFEEARAYEAINIYREYFKDIGLFENEVYAGVPAMLETLKANGKTLAVASSKPEVFVRRILEHFALDGYFAFAGGSALDGGRVKKAEVVRYVLSELGTAPSDAVMVGDREHDIFGARAEGLTSVGVLYGYGSRAEHESAGADFIAETVEELTALLLRI